VRDDGGDPDVLRFARIRAEGTLEAFVAKSVTNSRQREGSIETGRMTESAQVHGMLPVPAALLTDAGVVKLADARDSKSRDLYRS
jgi:hypothetical protein